MRVMSAWVPRVHWHVSMSPQHQHLQYVSYIYSLVLPGLLMRGNWVGPIQRLILETGPGRHTRHLTHGEWNMKSGRKLIFIMFKQSVLSFQIKYRFYTYKQGYFYTFLGLYSFCYSQSWDLFSEFIPVTWNYGGRVTSDKKSKGTGRKTFVSISIMNEA